MEKRAGRNPLINGPFARLWLAQGLSLLGDQIFDTTLVVYLAAVLGKGRTWAPLAVAGLFIVIAVPTVVIGPLAGVIVDRSDKRRMLIAMDALRAILVLALLPALGLVGGRHPSIAFQVTAIYLVVFATTTCSMFFSPARIALMGDIVPEPKQAQAQSLGQVNASIASILGPPLAVPILFLLGLHLALLADAFSFVLSFALILLVQAPEAARSGRPGLAPSFSRELREGLRFTASNPVVRTVVVGLFITTLGAGALNALDVFFVINNLHTPASLFGLVGAAMGAGVLAGAIITGAYAERIGIERLFWGSIIAIGLILLVYARMTTLAGGIVLLFLAGFPQAAANVAVGPIILRATPRDLVGRVVSVIQPAITLAGVISTAVAGYLASTVLFDFHATLGPVQFGAYDTIFSGAGILLLAGGVYSLVALRPTSATPPTSPPTR